LFVCDAKLRAEDSERNRETSRAVECSHAMERSNRHKADRFIARVGERGPGHQKRLSARSYSASPDFAVEVLQSARAGMLVSLALFLTLIMICAAFLAWMPRPSARS
jgi:hypothetical protein